ncbi:MAG: DNA polymerase III subunit gamma/tau [Pegethrix bostrychoides GSE-TBD4-15B]|jgi:DNA polymerase-3 subunit gamma/tau|uniref:DNA polymerase III subunit gamma/tau n=1 Tax=Pegethrix bostrychoides GSE-TBD4-15B TaxID=2839662 RepID=A0A951P9J1_9CYAN|nr:DNA polymerase III subunit gamma/tau [Pegethrix bostrychoides GSE-TBD4-15B]
MAYEPLHHKYRPQTLAELVGQEAITTTLTQALEQQKIAPAYLFTGARGTGKTSSARILSKSLNCLRSDRPTASPCGICEVCRSIANSSALDVIEIDAASNTGVDNIRELIERAQFAPVQCRYKVYSIDECHMLSTQAFNALLKTLEEPPDRVVFVLATTDPQRVLPTIISRCQRFDFRRIELGAMTRHLIKIADQEAIDISPEAVQLVAQLAQGGLRDAQSTLDQLSLLEGRIVPERVWDLVGAVPERDLLALVQRVGAGDSTGVIDGLRTLMDRGREPLIVLQNLASFYRDLLIAKTTPQRSDLVAVTAPTWAEMVSFVKNLSVSSLLKGQQQLRASELQIKNTTQPRLWLEVTLLGLLPEIADQTVPAVMSSSASISAPVSLPKAAAIPAAIPKPAPPPVAATPVVREVVRDVVRETVVAETVEQPKAPVEPPVEATTAAPTPAQAPAVPAAETNLEQAWQSILRLIHPPGTQELFKQQGRLLALEPQVARVGITSQPLFKMAQLRVANLETAFAQFVEHPIKVSLEVVAAPATSPASSLENISAAERLSPPQGSSRAVSAAPTAYRSPPQPSPAPPQPTSQTSSAQAPIAQAPPQPQPPAEPAVPAWQAEDEVSRAAKSFAQMFNGQIVSSAEPEPSVSEAAVLEAAIELEPEAGDPDDDVPF